MKSAIGLLICLFPLLSAADVVVAIGVVDEHVNIRMFPDSKSERVGRLEKHESAILVQSIPDWHEIEIAGGATGYISAEWTMILDDAPDAIARPIPVEAPVKVSLAAMQPESVAQPAIDLSVGASRIRSDGFSSDVEQDIAEFSAEEALAALSELESEASSDRKDYDQYPAGNNAEDVAKLITGEDRNKLSTMDIVSVLTRVVQQQQQQIDELKSRIEQRQ